MVRELTPVSLHTTGSACVQHTCVSHVSIYQKASPTPGALSNTWTEGPAPVLATPELV